MASDASSSTVSRLDGAEAAGVPGDGGRRERGLRLDAGRGGALGQRAGVARWRRRRRAQPRLQPEGPPAEDAHALHALRECPRTSSTRPLRHTPSRTLYTHSYTHTYLNMQPTHCIFVSVPIPMQLHGQNSGGSELGGHRRIMRPNTRG